MNDLLDYWRAEIKKILIIILIDEKKKLISKSFKKNLNNIEKNFNLLNDIYYVKKIEKACNLIIDCLKKKNKIIFVEMGDQHRIATI